MRVLNFQSPLSWLWFVFCCAEHRGSCCGHEKCQEDRLKLPRGPWLWFFQSHSLLEGFHISHQWLPVPCQQEGPLALSCVWTWIITIISKGWWPPPFCQEWAPFSDRDFNWPCHVNLHCVRNWESGKYLHKCKTTLAKWKIENINPRQYRGAQDDPVQPWRVCCVHSGLSWLLNQSSGRIWVHVSQYITPLSDVNANKRVSRGQQSLDTVPL